MNAVNNRPAGTRGLIQPEVDPGSTLDTAMALQLQPGFPLIVEDSIGGQDTSDLYRFELAEGQPINITLQGASGDVDLGLFDAEGNLIASSTGEGLVVENVNGEIPAGTYYVGVFPWEDANTTYSLSIEAGTPGGSAGPIHPEVDPGSTLDTAMALQLQPGVPLIVEDSIGGQDTSDLYSFELAEGQPINITLQGASGDVELGLFDAEGNLIASSTGEGLVVENVNGEIPAGTYYVGVFPWEDANTTYSLSIEAGTPGGGGSVYHPPSDPGDSFDTAAVLPLQPNAPLVVQEQVGASDPTDVYRIDLAQDQAISIAVQGQAGDVDLGLYDAQGNLLASSTNGGLDVDSIEGGLTAGTYYVAVLSYDGAETGYDLSVETGAPGAGAAAAASLEAPESLALRDQTGLEVGAAANSSFGQPREQALAGQLLAAA